MHKKVLFFWSGVGGSLIMAMFIAIYLGASPHDERNITLGLDVEPGVFYKSDSNFHVNLNSYGSQSFSYFSTSSDLKKYKYLHFSGVNIAPNYEVWLDINKESLPLFQGKMLKGESLIIELPWMEFNEQLIGELEMKLTVLPQLELGLNGTERYDLAFSAINLVSDSFYARLQYIKTWVSSTPSYGLSSLNYWQKHKLPMSITWAVLIWLTLVLFCAWLLKVSSKHLVLFLLVLTLPQFALLLFNQWQLKQQSVSMFDIDADTAAINELDSSIENFSRSFLNWISDEEMLKSIVLIQSNTAFEQSRLLYHLNRLNLFQTVDWQYVEALKLQKEIDFIYMVIPESIMVDCHKESIAAFVGFDEMELIFSHSNYCVVKL